MIEYKLNLIKKYIRDRKGIDIKYSPFILTEQGQIDTAYRFALKWYFENDPEFEAPIFI